MAGYDHDDCSDFGVARGGRGGTRVLMVAEKPSIANSLAAHLAPGGLDGGYRGSPPVHEFAGKFRGKSVTFVVTSVVGHIFSIDFPQQYSNWDTVDPVTLFTAPVHKKAEKGHIVKHLQELATGCEYLVLWLDCDREGENICFEVISCCHSKMRHIVGQQVFRAKFSAIAKEDIVRAMGSLVAPDENVSLSVDARQELDLKVGVAFSRFQTKYFQGKYGDLDAKLVSYGPCQTPTLGFCVDRHDEIMCFEPEDFWGLDVHICSKAGGSPVGVTWERERLFDQGATRVFESLVRTDGVVRVTAVTEKEGRRSRPMPLNTVDMLKVASKALGLGPHEAMRTAESLYLQGWTTCVFARPSPTHSLARLRALRSSSSSCCDSQHLRLARNCHRTRPLTNPFVCLPQISADREHRVPRVIRRARHAGGATLTPRVGGLCLSAARKRAQPREARR